MKLKDRILADIDFYKKQRRSTGNKSGILKDLEKAIKEGKDDLSLLNFLYDKSVKIITEKDPYSLLAKLLLQIIYDVLEKGADIEIDSDAASNFLKQKCEEFKKTPRKNLFQQVKKDFSAFITAKLYSWNKTEYKESITKYKDEFEKLPSKSKEIILATYAQFINSSCAAPKNDFVLSLIALKTLIDVKFGIVTTENLMKDKQEKEDEKASTNSPSGFFDKFNSYSQNFFSNISDFFAPDQNDLPSIILFGKAGVGKSSLLNVLISPQEINNIIASIHHPEDELITNNDLQVYNNNRDYQIIDTPGFGKILGSRNKRKIPNSISFFLTFEDETPTKIPKELLELINNTNVILFLTDCNPNTVSLNLDAQYLTLLKKTNKPIILVVTHIDQSDIFMDKEQYEKSIQVLKEKFNLDPIFTSVRTNYVNEKLISQTVGINKLLKTIFQYFPDPEEFKDIIVPDDKSIEQFFFDQQFNYLERGSKSRDNLIQNLEKAPDPNNFANDQDKIYALNVKGLIYYHCQKYQEAKKCFETALKLDPQNIFVLASLGLALTSLGDIEAGLKTLKEALQTKSIEILVRTPGLFIIQLLFATQKDQSKSRDLDFILNGESPFGSLLAKAYELIKINKTQEAEEYLQKVFSENPRRVFLWLQHFSLWLQHFPPRIPDNDPIEYYFIEYALNKKYYNLKDLLTINQDLDYIWFNQTTWEHAEDTFDVDVLVMLLNRKEPKKYAMFEWLFKDINFELEHPLLKQNQLLFLVANQNPILNGLWQTAVQKSKTDPLNYLKKNRKQFKLALLIVTLKTTLTVNLQNLLLTKSVQLGKLSELAPNTFFNYLTEALAEAINDWYKSNSIADLEILQGPQKIQKPEKIDKQEPNVISDNSNILDKKPEAIEKQKLPAKQEFPAESFKNILRWCKDFDFIALLQNAGKITSVDKHSKLRKQLAEKITAALLGENNAKTSNALYNTLTLSTLGNFSNNLYSKSRIVIPALNILFKKEKFDLRSFFLGVDQLEKDIFSLKAYQGQFTDTQSLLIELLKNPQLYTLLKNDEEGYRSYLAMMLGSLGIPKLNPYIADDILRTMADLQAAIQQLNEKDKIQDFSTLFHHLLYQDRLLLKRVLPNLLDLFEHFGTIIEFYAESQVKAKHIYVAPLISNLFEKISVEKDKSRLPMFNEDGQDYIDVWQCIENNLLEEQQWGILLDSFLANTIRENHFDHLCFTTSPAKFKEDTAIINCPTNFLGFKEVHFKNCSFHDLDMSKWYFKHCDFSGSVFQGKIVVDGTFVDSQTAQSLFPALVASLNDPEISCYLEGKLVLFDEENLSVSIPKILEPYIDPSDVMNFHIIKNVYESVLPQDINFITPNSDSWNISFAGLTNYLTSTLANTTSQVTEIVHNSVAPLLGYMQSDSAVQIMKDEEHVNEQTIANLDELEKFKKTIQGEILQLKSTLKTESENRTNLDEVLAENQMQLEEKMISLEQTLDLLQPIRDYWSEKQALKEKRNALLKNPKLQLYHDILLTELSGAFYTLWLLNNHLKLLSTAPGNVTELKAKGTKNTTEADIESISNSSNKLVGFLIETAKFKPENIAKTWTFLQNFKEKSLAGINKIKILTHALKFIPEAGDAIHAVVDKTLEAVEKYNDEIILTDAAELMRGWAPKLMEKKASEVTIKMTEAFQQQISMLENEGIQTFATCSMMRVIICLMWQFIGNRYDFASEALIAIRTFKIDLNRLEAPIIRIPLWKRTLSAIDPQLKDLYEETLHCQSGILFLDEKGNENRNTFNALPEKVGFMRVNQNEWDALQKYCQSQAKEKRIKNNKTDQRAIAPSQALKQSVMSEKKSVSTDKKLPKKSTTNINSTNFAPGGRNTKDQSDIRSFSSQQRLNKLESENTELRKRIEQLEFLKSKEGTAENQLSTPTTIANSTYANLSSRLGVINIPDLNQSLVADNNSEIAEVKFASTCESKPADDEDKSQTSEFDNSQQQFK